MIAFACASCNKKLVVNDEAAGKKVKCPGCGQVMPVPSPAVASPSASAQPRTLPSASVNAESRQVPPSRTGLPTPPPPDLPEGTGSSNPGPPEYDASLTAFLAPPQADDELGRLGEYRILKILGHGGMGVVFQGEDPKLGRKVAIKAMLPHLAGNQSSQSRFLREARAAAALEHDHIVAIYHVGEDRGAPFIVMP